MMYTELERNVIEFIEKNSDELFRVLSELIQIDSQNFRNDGREQKCAEYVRDLYQNLGLEVDFYCPDSLPDLLNILRICPAETLPTDPMSAEYGEPVRKHGESAWPLAAHTDTMPAGDLSNGLMIPSAALSQTTGLGAGDNKAGIAASYFAVKALMANSISLNTPVILTAYCDEEYGGGNGTLAACLKYPCKTYVNLDGGNYEMWTIAVGGGGFRID